MLREIKHHWLQIQAKASNLIIRVRARLSARPHMLKLWRRWKGARFLRSVSTVQAHAHTQAHTQAIMQALTDTRACEHEHKKIHDMRVTLRHACKCCWFVC